MRTRISLRALPHEQPERRDCLAYRNVFDLVVSKLPRLTADPAGAGAGADDASMRRREIERRSAGTFPC
jgi:hypothetical protein